MHPLIVARGHFAQCPALRPRGHIQWRPDISSADMQSAAVQAGSSAAPPPYSMVQIGPVPDSPPESDWDSDRCSRTYKNMHSDSDFEFKHVQQANKEIERRQDQYTYHLREVEKHKTLLARARHERDTLRIRKRGRAEARKLFKQQAAATAQTMAPAPAPPTPPAPAAAPAAAPGPLIGAVSAPKVQPQAPAA